MINHFYRWTTNPKLAHLSGIAETESKENNDFYFDGAENERWNTDFQSIRELLHKDCGIILIPNKLPIEAILTQLIVNHNNF